LQNSNLVSRMVHDTPLHDPVAHTSAGMSRIHMATLSDVPFIVDAIVEGSGKGHFSCDCSQPDVLRGLLSQIQTVVTDGVILMPGPRNGAGGRAFVLQAEKRNIGFAILVEDQLGIWHESVEVFAMSVSPEFRGAGHGRYLLNKLVSDSQSAHVYARVAFSSTSMTRLLESSGFSYAKHSGHGTFTLEVRREIA
jgi:ribosomal protein S18 acetylase RimI-like enzyme